MSHNGGNGIYCEGTPLIGENMGSDNELFGILIVGNPATLFLPNSLEGNLGAELPPVQLVDLPTGVYGAINIY